MKTEKIVVANLKSEGCINKITWKILKMPGVSNVFVDMEHNMVMIEHRESLERPAYLQALSTLGYPETADENGLMTHLSSYANRMAVRTGQ